MSSCPIVLRGLDLNMRLPYPSTHAYSALASFKSEHGKVIKEREEPSHSEWLDATEFHERQAQLTQWNDRFLDLLEKSVSLTWDPSTSGENLEEC